MPNNMPHKRLTYDESLGYLEKLCRHQEAIHRIEKKTIYTSDSAGHERLSLQLPVTFPTPNPNEPLEQYPSTISPEPPPCIIFLIQAGAAALGCFEKGSVVSHKVITKYMVRKKQGKAQLTYLRQKGKSRKGSRLRLRAGLFFFEEINTKLSSWRESLEKSSSIFYSCPIRLMNEMYLSKKPPPFERRDAKMQKIPFDVQVPTFKELLRINYLLNSGYLIKNQTDL